MAGSTPSSDSTEVPMPVTPGNIRVKANGETETILTPYQIDAMFEKIQWKLIPFLMFLYFLAFLVGWLLLHTRFCFQLLPFWLNSWVVRRTVRTWVTRTTT